MQLEAALDAQVVQLMGDIPINLNSPEQLSWVIYSRKPKDKKVWADSFTHGMQRADFTSTVTALSNKMYKSKAVQCSRCYGTGKVRKTKKDGAPFSRSTKCASCDGLGYLF